MKRCSRSIRSELAGNLTTLIRDAETRARAKVAALERKNPLLKLTEQVEFFDDETGFEFVFNRWMAHQPTSRSIQCVFVSIDGDMQFTVKPPKGSFL